MRICYFGGFDPQYSRNNFLRKALAQQGVEIVLCQVSPSLPTIRKMPHLLRQYWPIRRNIDLILVAEFQQTIVPFAWLLGLITRKPVVFDFILSMYEAVIVERQKYGPKSLHALRYWWMDKIASVLAKKLIVQTAAYGESFQERFGIPQEKMVVIPLGVDETIFTPIEPAAKANADGPVKVLFIGTYIPNHGVDVIVDAITILKDDPRFTFCLLGDGEGRPWAEQTAGERALPIEFLPRVPLEELREHIARADIVLGIFGVTPQADKALAFKVLQPLAMRQTVLAGDTLSIREHFTPGEHLLTVPLGNAEALAAGLSTLADDPALRARLAATGYERYRERLTLDVIGRQLKVALADVVG